MRITSLLIIPALASVAMHAQPGVGTVYGTRNPITCKSTKEPLKGGLSTQQAALYVRCGREGIESDSHHNLFLLENVQLEVGKGRPYEAADHANDIDPAQLVYPVRGVMDVYQ